VVRLYREESVSAIWSAPRSKFLQFPRDPRQTAKRSRTQEPQPGRPRGLAHGGDRRRSGEELRPVAAHHLYRGRASRFRAFAATPVHEALRGFGRGFDSRRLHAARENPWFPREPPPSLRRRGAFGGGAGDSELRPHRLLHRPTYAAPAMSCAAARCSKVGDAWLDSPRCRTPFIETRSRVLLGSLAANLVAVQGHAILECSVLKQVTLQRFGDLVEQRSARSQDRRVGVEQ
jgi:hypothetical protein